MECARRTRAEIQVDQQVVADCERMIWTDVHDRDYAFLGASKGDAVLFFFPEGFAPREQQDAQDGASRASATGTKAHRRPRSPPA